ncbi:MAG: bifunctional alpha/beta hydrolase/OsmC family protein [Pseudomonadota bacterium]
MQSERVTFENDNGETLSGLIDWPGGAGGGHHAIALFAHCFTCTKNLRAATNISRALTDAGIAVMRFDFTGLGDSGGAFEDTTFTSNVSDLIAAAHWLRDTHGAPQLLVGHSLGGTAVLHAAATLDDVVAVATIGAPAEASHVRHLFSDAEDAIRADGSAEVVLAGRPFRIGAGFLDDLDSQPPLEMIRRLRKALLVLHSPIDDTVEIDNASALFANAMHPKSFVSLDGADHLLSRPEDAAWAGSVIAGWAQRFLSAPEMATPAEPGHTVAVTRAGSFRTPIQSGRHAIMADEPASVGGSDSGPTPHELLSAALASCTSMTLQMYAKHKGIALDRAEVDVSHEKRDDGDGNGRYDAFTRVIRVEGDFDETVRERMLEIADKCPVHRTLHGRVVVENVLG